jgi:hypothetical protein
MTRTLAFLLKIFIGFSALFFQNQSFAWDAYVRGEPFASIYKEDDLYLSKVQPILDKRCAVCHSCFEAPCQLKLTSPEMLVRGATKHLSNGGVFAVPRTDLMLTLKEQRAGGFFSILEGAADSIFVNVLTAGRENSRMSTAPDSLTKPLIEKYIAPKDRQCVANAEAFRKIPTSERKRLGMPYFMAPLTDEEYSVLVNWASSGAQMPSVATMKRLAQPKDSAVVQDWEEFFNTPTWKAKWTSRFLYEHLFTGHFYFDQSPGEYYQIVRSRSAAPFDISEIASERPFSMEKGLENKFYYRFRKVASTILHKQNFVYHVKADTMAELKNWFWNSNWLYSQESKPFSFDEPNPFHAFSHIPANARYRWLLKNARMILDMDMRSDNCHGNGATGPLHENFLIFFIKPESDVAVRYPEFFEEAKTHLDMANVGASNGTTNLAMNFSFKKQQIEYGKIKRKYQNALLPNGLTFDDVWDGENETETAFFTLMRHEGTVSIHNGAWGPMQRVSLLFDYVTFERMYYNCVGLSSLFDNINDKIGTVLYLRDVGRELEEQFLSLIPDEARQKIRNDWIQGAGAKSSNLYDATSFALPYNYKQMTKFGNYYDRNSPYYSTLFALLTQSGRFTEKSVSKYFYPTSVDSDEMKKLKEATKILSQKSNAASIDGSPGNPAHHFPTVSYIMIKNSDGSNHYYTVVVSRFYEYINYLPLTPPGRYNHGRDPKRDYMAIFPGLHANYPGKTYVADEKHFQLLVDELKAVKSESDYADFDRNWGLQKMSSQFWSTMDQIQQDFIKTDVIHNGLLDLSEYGMKDVVGSP